MALDLLNWLNNLSFTTELNLCMRDHSSPDSAPPSRKLIVLFDGTGQNLDSGTNVAHLRSALVQVRNNNNGEDIQIVHYEPGIGSAANSDSSNFSRHRNGNKTRKGPGQTHNLFERYLHRTPKALRIVDQAVAISLKEHLLSAYTFLVNNYQRNDKIYIFGYSRGDHLARALVGMIYKVGLVPGGNREQMRAAYDLYQRDDKESWLICEWFRRAQGLDPTIEFLGLWDTVSSVGLIPRHLPFTRASCPDTVKVFRHAVCIDERRARFSPNLYKPPVARDGTPQVVSKELTPEDLFASHRMNDRPTDVQEIWFAGCHSDVGGSKSDSEKNHSLSKIPLRWMIRQCYETNTGLRFHRDKLIQCGFDPNPPWNPEQLRRIPKENHEAIKAALAELYRAHKNPSGVDTFVETHRSPQVPNSELTAEELVMRSAVEEEISLNDLLDSLTPMHDAISWKGFYWILLGLRNRDPVYPYKMHRTVMVRQEALQWVLDRQSDENIGDQVKKLGLKPYVPRFLRKNRKKKHWLVRQRRPKPEQL